MERGTSKNNNDDNNNSAEITEDTTMEDLQESMRQIEAGLDVDPLSLHHRPQSSSGGRTAWSSLGSALQSLRERFMERHNNSNDAPNDISERLRVAELAHATRTPLGRLQSELQRRQSATTTTSATGAGAMIASTGGRRLPVGGPEPLSSSSPSNESNNNVNNNHSSNKRRRKSDLLASRSSSLANSASDLEESHSENEECQNKVTKDAIDADDTKMPCDDARLHRELSRVPGRRVLSDIDEGSHEESAAANTATTSALDSTRAVVKEATDDDGKSSMEVEVILDEKLLVDENNNIPETEILLSEEMSHKLDEDHRSVLFRSTASSSILTDMDLDDDNDETTKEKQPWLPQVYSWGVTKHSLYDGEDSGDPDDLEPVGPSSRIGRIHVVGVATNHEHSAVVTNTGAIYTCGKNTHGAVDPSKPLSEVILKPTLLESVTVPVLQVSCGRDHTAALTANGTVLTWGNNNFGQLGHRTPQKSLQERHRPQIMALGQRRAATVACGDGFTLVLTSRMQVLACGIPTVAGYHTTSTGKPHLPAPLPELFGLPITKIAAGQRHAIVVTCHGTAFAWGDNHYGQCGQEYPKELRVPVPMRTPVQSLVKRANLAPLPPREISIVNATCGDEHTILVTKNGQLLVCGNNSKGQLMLPVDVAYQLRPVTHPAQDGRFIYVAAGHAHSLALDDGQDLWYLGGKDNNAASKKDAPTIKCILRDRFIVGVAAGGNHSVAITAMPMDAIPHTLSPPKPIHRNFSQLVADSTALDTSQKMVRSKDSEVIQHNMEDLVLAVSEQQQQHHPANKNMSLSQSAVQELGNRAEELLQCPAVLNSLFLDPMDLDVLYEKVLDASSDRTSRQILAKAMERGIFQGLESLETESGHACLKFPESVRFLLLYLQCPLFTADHTDITFDRRGDLMLLLCESFLGLSYEGYRAMVAWVTSLYPREVFVKCLLQPLLKQLERGLDPNAGPVARIVPLVVAVLKWLYITSERAGGIAKKEDFWSHAVATRDPGRAYNDLRLWKKCDKKERSSNFFMCSHSFLFSPATKRNLLAIENEMEMVATATSEGVRINIAEQTIEFNPFWKLEIEREHMLTQTLQIVRNAKATDLRKKLKVVFKGEEGVDAGGVTREFFQLLSLELFDISSGMWSNRFDEEDITWFNSDCFWNDEGYYLVGILVGLAVYNSVLLDVHFPSAVYRKLLGLPLGLEDMVDSRLRQSLQQLLDYEGDDVEDIFCLTFSLHWMDLGTERIVELKPGGANIAVTCDNKEEYVRLYVKWLLEESIHPQYDAFERGFMKVMEHSTLDFMTPEELELLVVGSPELDFNALEESTTYEGYEKDDPVIQHLWTYVRNAPEETQLKFLKFCTGSSKAPIGGLGQLPFKIQKNGSDSMQLPTSHTCFHSLLLPDYGDNYDKVAERLGRAILECEGFGLQ